MNNEFTSNNENFELEEMRAQMSLLKNRLGQQEVVNDQLLQKAMQQKMGWIHKYVKLEAFVGIPFIILAFGAMAGKGLISWLLFAFTVVICILDVVADWKINKTQIGDFASDNLLQMGKRLKAMKQARMKQLYYSLPILLLWVVGMAKNFMHNGAQALHPELLDPELIEIITVSLTVTLVVGVLVGLGLAYYIVRKMQRTNDELISQIDELSKEE